MICNTGNPWVSRRAATLPARAPTTAWGQGVALGAWKSEIEVKKNASG